MFCPGTAVLNDGRLMITGGQTSRRVTFYDPFLDEWAIGPQMIIGRGYQSQLTLEEGSVFVLGGSWNGGIGGKDGEVWTEAGGWQLKPGIRAIGSINTNDIEGLFRSDSHMWLFEAPNGRIFHAGPAKRMHWIDLDGNGTVTQSLLRGDDLDAMNGNAVMYDVGKIFTVGGAENYDSGHASSRAYAIDINGGEALVQRVGDMSFPRAFCNSVVLPSGEIIVVGGQEKVKLFSDTDAVLYVEIWDPWTGEFTELSSLITVPRTYHSIGLLLRDGRVLSGGGGLCGNSCDYATEINHPNVEIITPPYLFTANGTLADRPIIQSAPESFSAGGSFTVVLESEFSLVEFVLIRYGAATHAVNLDQRRVPLAIANQNGNSFDVVLPSNPRTTPPGLYWLFCLGDGVPSVGWNLMRAK